MTDRMVNESFTAPGSVVDQATALAHTHKLTKAEFYRRAVADYVKKMEKKPVPSQ